MIRVECINKLTHASISLSVSFDTYRHEHSSKVCSRALVTRLDGNFRKSAASQREILLIFHVIFSSSNKKAICFRHSHWQSAAVGQQITNVREDSQAGDSIWLRRFHTCALCSICFG